MRIPNTGLGIHKNAMSAFPRSQRRSILSIRPQGNVTNYTGNVKGYNGYVTDYTGNVTVNGIPVT